MKKILLCSILLIGASVLAQRKCATMEKLEQKMQNNPAFKAHHNEVMQRIQSPTTTLNRMNGTQSQGVVTIPVVFHILYKTANQNISEAQINSQLASLNQDFRKLNADFSTVVPAAFQPFGADMEVVFVMATRTPAGLPTNGITRKSVSSTFTFEDDYYKNSGEPIWDPSSYLNIWVGRFTDDELLGFAYLPSSAGDIDDGLCIGDQFLGSTGTATAPFNRGRTATHEIGHYFGLLHPWGNDNSSCGTNGNSDGVADTPATNGPYDGCPSFPNNLYTCSSSANGAMFMNYMDYVNDRCMAFFTTGQKEIVRNTLAEERLSLLSSTGALSVKELEAVQAIALSPNPAGDHFVLTSPLIAVDYIEIYNTTGQLVKSQKIDQNSKINIEAFETGVYYLRIYDQGKFLKSDKLIKR